MKRLPAFAFLVCSALFAAFMINLSEQESIQFHIEAENGTSLTTLEYVGSPAEVDSLESNIHKMFTSLDMPITFATKRGDVVDMFSMQKAPHGMVNEKVACVGEALLYASNKLADHYGMQSNGEVQETWGNQVNFLPTSFRAPDCSFEYESGSCGGPWWGCKFTMECTDGSGGCIYVDPALCEQ